MDHVNASHGPERRRVVIGHAEHEQIVITIISRDSADWRTAHVHIACDVWRGSFVCEFFGGELDRFGREIQQLYQSLSGSAVLNALEPNLTLQMVGDGRGHITVAGRAEAQFYSGTYLVFGFTLDQTELPAIAAALMHADRTSG